MKTAKFVLSILSVSFVFIFYLSSSTLLAEEVKRVEERTFKVEPGSEVSIYGDEGRIIIKSWDRNEVYLKMTKQAWGRDKEEAMKELEDIRIDIEQRRGRLIIEELDRDRHRHRNFRVSDIFRGRWHDTKVDYELKVPREIELDIKNDEGNIEISDIRGRIRIEIDEGEVFIRDIESDDITIHTDEGNININRVKDLGRDPSGLFIKLDEGRLKLTDIRVNELRIDTDEGDIIIDALSAKRVDAFTDEGDIEVDLEPVSGGKYELQADEGDIFVKLPTNASIEVDAETNDGRIKSDFDDLRSSRGKRRRYDYDDDDEERLRGRIGNGDALLIISTDEGNINIERR